MHAACRPSLQAAGSRHGPRPQYGRPRPRPHPCPHPLNPSTPQPLTPTLTPTHTLASHLSPLTSHLSPLTLALTLTLTLTLTLHLKVFLDVDDLEDISDLEGYIDRTEIVFVYCSQGYFDSKNCMRELTSSVKKRKQMIACVDLDPTRGGLSLDEVRRQLDAADASYAKWGFPEDTPTGSELHAHLFRNGAFEWNRIGAFQDVTMRLIAERLLVGGRKRLDTSANLTGRVRKSELDKEQASRKLWQRLLLPKPKNLSKNKYFLQGEIIHKKVTLPPPNLSRGHIYHVYCSRLNPGGEELVREVCMHACTHASMCAQACLAAGSVRNVSGFTPDPSPNSLTLTSTLTAALTLTVIPTLTLPHPGVGEARPRDQLDDRCGRDGCVRARSGLLDEPHVDTWPSVRALRR